MMIGSGASARAQVQPPNLPSRSIQCNANLGTGPIEIAALGNFTTRKHFDLMVVLSGRLSNFYNPMVCTAQYEVAPTLTGVTGLACADTGLPTDELLVSNGEGLAKLTFHRPSNSFVRVPLTTSNAWQGARALTTRRLPGSNILVVAAIAASGQMVVTGYYDNGTFTAGVPLATGGNILRIQLTDIDGTGPLETAVLASNGRYLFRYDGVMIQGCPQPITTPVQLAKGNGVERVANVKFTAPSTYSIETRTACSNAVTIALPPLAGANGNPLLGLSAFDIADDGNSEFLLSFADSPEVHFVRPDYSGGSSLTSTTRRLRYHSMPGLPNTLCAPLWQDLNRDRRPDLVSFAYSDRVLIAPYNWDTYQELPGPPAIGAGWSAGCDGRIMRLSPPVPPATAHIDVWAWRQLNPFDPMVNPTQCLQATGIPLFSGPYVEEPISCAFPATQAVQPEDQPQGYWPDRDHYYCDIVFRDASHKILFVETMAMTMLPAANDDPQAALAEAAAYLNTLPMIPSEPRQPIPIHPSPGQGLGARVVGIVMLRTERPSFPPNTPPIDG